MFAALRPLIKNADVAICHEEVPFAGPGEPLQSYPVFAAPPQVAPWIASMGWDACTTASNHAVDQGFEGLKETADLLEANGVAHVGTFRSQRERRQPVIVTTDDGVRVGIVAGTFSLNGFPLPEGRPWSVSMWDAPNLLAQAKQAREAGADIVVVHIHGGTEYDHLPNADQVALVRRLTAVSRRRHRARRPRPRRAADHPGQRQVGGLRDGQHGRPAGPGPAAHLRRHHA